MATTEADDYDVAVCVATFGMLYQRARRRGFLTDDEKKASAEFVLTVSATVQPRPTQSQHFSRESE